MKNIKITFILLLSALIASCGFQLRGTQDLSKVLPDINVQGINKFSDIGRELVRSLATANVNVFDESATLLNVTRNSFTKRVLSIDNTGLANQYELRYDISFVLVKKVDGKIIDLIPAQSVSERREYVFDANQILAKVSEENRLKQDMRQALIMQLMRRLKFLLKSKNKTLK